MPRCLSRREHLSGWQRRRERRLTYIAYRGRLRGNWPEVLSRNATRGFIVGYELLLKAVEVSDARLYSGTRQSWYSG